MKIAICDDELADLNLIQTYCRQYDAEIPTAAFTCGEALLAAYEKDFFDLVFLDIELGQRNGLLIGKRLKELPRSPEIVFITHSLMNAAYGFGIALWYLPKPVSYAAFSNILGIALESILPKTVSIFSNAGQPSISINTILYFEVSGHQLSAHLCNGGKISTRGTLTEAISQTPSHAFAQPHKSYYINMEYIDQITQQGVLMTNGALIPIGRGRKDDFQLRLREYIRRKARI